MESIYRYFCAAGEISFGFHFAFCRQCELPDTYVRTYIYVSNQRCRYVQRYLREGLGECFFFFFR